jgi:hypothetical protein
VLRILLKLQLLTIKHRVGIVPYPVAQIDVPGLAFHIEIEWQVAVAEYKIVHVLFFQVIPAEKIQPLVFSAQEFFVGAGGHDPASFAAAAGDVKSEVRMKAAEKPLAGPVCKNSAQQLVSFIAGPESVAMANKEFPAAEFAQHGLVVYLNAELFCKIAPHPQVVVTCKEMHRRAGVCDLGDLSEKPYAAFRHGVPVFEPEIEKVANQEEFCCV